MPKILGGFINYFNAQSSVLYGRRLEWGTYHDKNEFFGILHVELTEGYCTLDMGLGYCFLTLVISTKYTDGETGYDIRGGRYIEGGNGTVTMSWGVDSTASGFTDTHVATWDRTDLPSANLHFMIQQISGAVQFSDICMYLCTTDETFTSLTMINNSSAAHEIANFECWSNVMNMIVTCKLYIWD